MSEKELIAKGRVVWEFGDNFNSDTVTQYPRYKDVSDVQGLKRICMIGLDPGFPNRVAKGDLMIAGKNFGFGHPHAQAHLSLEAAGISCIVAESFARGWFRTAISVGLPAVACEGIRSMAKVGDVLHVDFKTGLIQNLSKNMETRAEPLPDIILDIVKDGGTVPHLRRVLPVTPTSNR